MLNELFVQVVEQVTGIISGMGYWGIALCMAIESCNVPLPSEIIQPFSGYLVSTGRFGFVPAVLAGTIGGTFGSVVSYYIGSFAMDSPLLFWISKKKKARLIAWFDIYGDKTAFFSRLLPGVRTFISLPAGAARMDIRKFTLYTFLGSLVWSTLLTYLGYMLGANWVLLRPYFKRLDMVVVIGILLFICYLLLQRYLFRTRN